MDNQLVYPNRKCPVCGGQFTPKHCAQVTCCKDCSTSWQRQRKAASRRRMATSVVALRMELERVRLELKDCVESRKAQGGSPMSLRECKRMSVRALNLPCGERDECWMGKACEHVPAGAVKPKRLP